VEAVLAEPCLKQAQRHMARVILRVPAAKLAKLTAPGPDLPGLQIYLTPGADHAAQTAQSLREAGIAVACQPAILAQLAAALPLMGDTIRPGAYFDMIRRSVVPFLQVRCPGFPADQRALVLPPFPPRFVGALARVFPAARYVVLRPDGTPSPVGLANALSRVEVEFIHGEKVKEALLF
jgi:hypothetical protein